MDVCRVFGPVQNLTCHECEENFLVGNERASCKRKKLFSYEVQHSLNTSKIVKLYHMMYLLLQEIAIKRKLYEWLILLCFCSTVDCRNVSTLCMNCSLEDGICFGCVSGTYLNASTSECQGYYDTNLLSLYVIIDTLQSLFVLHHFGFSI